MFDMRARAIFDFHCGVPRIQLSRRDVASGDDWVTPTTTATSRIARVRCSILSKSVWDPVRMRAVSKVITATARVTGRQCLGNLVAAPRAQASEPQAGSRTAQWSYGSELSAAAASFV
jgi:hypothetical protein